MTDPTDLIAQADAALDGVTEGPWHAMGDGDLDGWFIGGGGYVRANTVGPPDERGPNARFIAASRQLVPALRDALAAALTRLAKIESIEEDINVAIDNAVAERAEELQAALAAALTRATMAERHEEELEASLAEMTRRRNEWRKKAEGFDEVRLALREKVGEPWPPSLSRILWAGLAADQKRRADDAEAERDAALTRAEAAECHAEAMEAERDRLPQVKPLVWESPSASNNWIYQAHAPWGTYGVHICGGKHQAWLEAHEKPYEQWLGDGYVGSVMEAQSVADQDHRQRVMDLLCARTALPGEPQP